MLIFALLYLHTPLFYKYTKYIERRCRLTNIKRIDSVNQYSV